MSIPFIILCLKTLILWFLVVVLHQQKYRITIIPLYAYIAVLTILMHNFTDLDFAIVIDQWYFLISSFSLFTTLMFGVLFLYLFEGPRAARVALWVILFSSFFYIWTVYFLGFEVDTTKWVQLDTTQLVYYFWSLIAIISDIIFLGVFWEMLSKIKSLNLMLRVFLVTFGVFALDAIVFTTGAFWHSEFYFQILKGNIYIRFFLSLIGAPIMAHFLRAEGFVEERRSKPKNLWEIINFRSDLEMKILSLEEMIENKRQLEEKLRDSQEKYELVINGVGAGIWDWDVPPDRMTWSPKFCKLLGCSVADLGDDLAAFKGLIHPEDADRAGSAFEDSLKSGNPIDLELRLRDQTGKYRWFFISGVVKQDSSGRALRVVGSIIDIDNRKEAEIAVREKVKELSKMNEMMLGRELKMIELKKEIDELKAAK